MNPVDNHGFTIIEVMLFLGISGLLFFALMIGTGGSVNEQRYRDSVQSLQSALQKQYNEANNVINNSSTVSCSGETKNRGQSDCVVLGRFITTRDISGNLSDKVLTIKNVIGTEPIDSSLLNDDLDDIKKYNIKVTDTEISTYEMEWGSSISTTGPSPTSKYFSMLIIKSPASGQTRTFLDDSTPIPTPEYKIAEMIDVGGLSHVSIPLCVNSNGSRSGVMLAVSINSGANSPSGIEILREIESPCS